MCFDADDYCPFEQRCSEADTKNDLKEKPMIDTYPSVEWENFSNGGAKADLCFRAIIGHSLGYDETYHKRFVSLAVGKNGDGYFVVIDSDPATRREIEAPDLNSAKHKALDYVAETIGNWIKNDLFKNAVDKSRNAVRL
jgi:hypothetical protein